MKKKVLFLIPSMIGLGGTERVVHTLSMLFKSDGHEVFIATFDSPGASRHYKSEVSLHSLGPIPRLPLVLRPFVYGIAVMRLRRLKRRLNIDCTISNLWGADLISALSGSSDKKIALCHTTVLNNADNQLMVRLRPFVAVVYRVFDKVIAVSKPLAKELADLYCLSTDRIDCIENFVDRPNAISIVPSDGVLRAVWCGRMVSVKNVDGLLHAWSRWIQIHGHAQLLLLGDGVLRRDMENLAIELGLRVSYKINDANAQVVFLGNVPNPEVYVSGVRVLLLTSSAEGIPMVILESLALGVPVLASDCQPGGVRSALIDEGKCNPMRKDVNFTTSGALLAIPNAADETSLSGWVKCLSLALHDEARWSDWCKGALERSMYFSRAVMGKKWLTLIEKLPCK